LLERFKDLDGGHAGPAEKNCLRLWGVDLASELVCSLGGFLVDVRDVVEAPVTDDLEPVLLQVRLALEGDGLAVGRAERNALYAEVLKRGS
jgi:hypothetical protein